MLALSNNDFNDAVAKGLEILNLQYLLVIIDFQLELRSVVQDIFENVVLILLLLHQKLNLPWLEIDQKVVVYVLCCKDVI